LQATESEHWLPLGALTFLLVFVSGKMVLAGGKVHRWSLRLCAAAFVAYAVLGVIRLAPQEPADFLLIGIRALFAAGILFGLACITLAILGFVYGSTIGAIRPRLQRWSTVRRAAAQKHRQEQEEQRCRRREQQEWLRRAPERAQAEHETLQQAEQQQR